MALDVFLKMPENTISVKIGESGLFTDIDSAFKQNQFELEVQKNKIHVRFQKLGPRSITMIEGLDDDLDQKRIAKAMKKRFKCSASLHKDDDGNELIKLQGDHRISVREWLVEQQILTASEAKDRLIIHGF